ncbi:hypothetical protein M431DRAFT_403089 [Trichoderma harzianum CBS 226.95]|uniref:Uncharacterized protein n=1 Tax=Trichoderma harzianum CBS 226.95 TaxID=983964 RepID=A0A2T4AEM1_TRIHA|nr:hypothetical protein M431DRAFT_403089 [Trichoderma harzianum CBS 226.95]PTB55531.1 hypothetical protein M431DRAFT_403089 [Trichoderma harzianum CBS 226.95]
MYIALCCAVLCGHLPSIGHRAANSCKCVNIAPLSGCRIYHIDIYRTRADYSTTTATSTAPAQHSNSTCTVYSVRDQHQHSTSTAPAQHQLFNIECCTMPTRPSPVPVLCPIDKLPRRTRSAAPMYPLPVR